MGESLPLKAKLKNRLARRLRGNDRKGPRRTQEVSEKGGTVSSEEDRLKSEGES